MKKETENLHSILNGKVKFTIIQCRKCGTLLKVDSKCISGICAKCTVSGVPLDKLPVSKVTPDKPAGWKFMHQFVDAEGNVYEFGVINQSLKGTLPPTDVQKIREEQKEKRKAKKEKKEMLRLKRLERENKKRLKEKQKADKKK